MLGPGLVLTGQEQRAETPRSRTCLNNSFHEHANMFFRKTRRRTLLPSIPHIAERCLISLKINQVGGEAEGRGVIRR